MSETFFNEIKQVVQLGKLKLFSFCFLNQKYVYTCGLWLTLSSMCRRQAWDRSGVEMVLLA